MISAPGDVKKFYKEPRMCPWCGQIIEKAEEAEYIENKRHQKMYIHTGCAYMVTQPKRAKS